MAKSPNTTPFNGISASFTYSYPNWNNNFANALFNAADKERNEAVQDELAWLDYVENEFISEMTEYPEAEQIIKNILDRGV